MVFGKKKELDEKTLLSEINKRKAEGERILADPQKIKAFLKDLAEKIQNLTDNTPLQGLMDEILLLGQLVKDVKNNDYREISKMSMVSVVAALVYFVSPVDLFPDPIPFLGYIDDAAVISFTLRHLKGDLDRYRIWREEREAEEAYLEDYSKF